MKRTYCFSARRFSALAIALCLVCLHADNITDMVIKYRRKQQRQEQVSTKVKNLTLKYTSRF